MDKPIPEAVLDRLAHEAYQVHCDTPTRAFPNDTHWPKWRAVVQHVADALTAAQQQGQEGGGDCTKCRGTGEVCTGYIDGTPEMFDCTCPAAAPPSAPVGAAQHWHDLYRKECLLRQDDAARYGQQIADLEALAQQPAAVDGATYTAEEVAEAMGVLRGRHGSTALHAEVLNDMERTLTAALATQHQEPSP